MVRQPNTPVAGPLGSGRPMVELSTVQLASAPAGSVVSAHLAVHDCEVMLIPGDGNA